MSKLGLSLTLRTNSCRVCPLTEPDYVIVGYREGIYVSDITAVSVLQACRLKNSYQPRAKESVLRPRPDCG